MEGRGKGRGNFPLKPLADLRSDGIVESFSNATAISRERRGRYQKERAYAIVPPFSAKPYNS